MKITICGDICPTALNYKLFKECDIDTLFGDVLVLLKESDRVIVNLECALTDSDNPISKMGPPLKAAPESAKTLAEAGITDCALSNNHIFDYGIQGLRDTIKALEQNSLFWTGVGENEDNSRQNHIIEIDGKKLAVIAVCEHEYTYALPDRPGARPYDPYHTMEDIRTAKNDADFAVVLYHGGKEHCEYPSPRLRKLCHAMAKNGADAVLCQHSHCIGCTEEYNGCHILYGQGNFHFIKYPDRPQWQSGIAVQLDINNEMAISFIPFVVSGTGITIATDSIKDSIMSSFYARSELLKNGGWMDKWHEFCVDNTDSYLKVISNAFTGMSTDEENQLFAHFLDCEAHTDVWRELLPTWNHSNKK